MLLLLNWWRWGWNFLSWSGVCSTGGMFSIFLVKIIVITDAAIIINFAANVIFVHRVFKALTMACFSENIWGRGAFVRSSGTCWRHFSIAKVCCQLQFHKLSVLECDPEMLVSRVFHVPLCCCFLVSGPPAYTSSWNRNLWLSGRFQADRGNSIQFTTISLGVWRTFNKADSQRPGHFSVRGTEDHFFGINEPRSRKSETIEGAIGFFRQKIACNKTLSENWLCNDWKWIWNHVTFWKCYSDVLFQWSILQSDFFGSENIMAFSYTTLREYKIAICRPFQFFRVTQIIIFSEKKLICSLNKLPYWDKPIVVQVQSKSQSDVSFRVLSSFVNVMTEEFIFQKYMAPVVFMFW